MTIAATAFLNQRFQFSYDVSVYASLYAGLGTAVWRCQVRPSAGSPTVLLDFATNGSPQSAANVIVYYPLAGLITVFCPTASMVGLAPGTYIFDFGFILQGADFEIVDGGTITFQFGSTAAGVQGSPAAPPGSDDTVTLTSSSMLNQVPGSIVDALAAANSSAAAAAAQATQAAASAAAALASANRANAMTIIAMNADVAAETAAASAIASAGVRLCTQTLVVTSTNTLSELTYAYSGVFSIMVAKGTAYISTGSGSAYYINGSNVGWYPANASGVNLNPGDLVVLSYSYSAVPPGASEDDLAPAIMDFFTSLPNVQRDGIGAEPAFPNIPFVNASGFIVMSQ